MHDHIAWMHLVQPRRMPAPLKPGDQILLAAPARFVLADQVLKALETIERAGFVAVVPPSLEARDGQFGGTDAQRAELLNEGFRDPSIRAIWVMRGGYGCARVLPLLNSESFQSDPTWIIGFSDVTALHAWSDCQGVGSMHAPVANAIDSTLPEHTALLWKRLMEGGSPDGTPVVGGNLSVLYSLLGTPYFPHVEGCWILLEDLDEYLYHIDRMLLAFKLAGVFDRMHGLLMGTFSDLHDNTPASGQSLDNPFGRTVRQMVEEHVPSAKPVHWDLPVGHGQLNKPIILGADLGPASRWK